ncbi:hypothetical protein ANRL1_04555 [Anaerolineae bacterium]|nr:hypothetical protein ANRL1_04555 [Anaerolineae bacterium]
MAQQNQTTSPVQTLDDMLKLFRDVATRVFGESLEDLTIIAALQPEDYARLKKVNGENHSRTGDLLSLTRGDISLTITPSHADDEDDGTRS